MLGDQMLFWRQDSVERSWSFLTPILDRCEDCDDQPDMLEFYQAGSTGPAAVSRLVDMAGEDWNQENGALLCGESHI